MMVLVVDVGGTHVKVLATRQKELRQVASGKTMTARQMVRAVKGMTRDWRFDVVSIGFPGPVVHGRPVSNPPNLGGGWVGFDYRRAFGKPVKVVNDAAMQALGSYEGGRMLFLGLGTGLGSALIVDGVLEPMELGHLPYRDGKTYEDYLGQRGLKRVGERRWRTYVADVVGRLRAGLQADYVVIGGGNVRLLDRMPRGARPGKNSHAFDGGFRLWQPPRSGRSRMARR